MGLKRTKVSDYEERIIYQDASGDAGMRVFKLFEGVELAYNSVHMTEQRLWGVKPEGTVVEIRYCRMGHVEQHLDDHFFYLAPGDLAVIIWDKDCESAAFPLKHYHGITITIHIGLAPECFSCYMREVSVQPGSIAKRLCGDGHSFVVRNQQAIGHIFTQLYSVPHDYKIGYLKIKVLELLMLLDSIDPHENRASLLSVSQVSLAKRIAAYLSQRLEQGVTVAQVADEFCLSEGRLQEVFSGVYGMPIMKYMRTLKMQSAALRLVQTEKPVIEIAGELGYDNASKFSAAFRAVMGQTPASYRRAHGKGRVE